MRTFGSSTGLATLIICAAVAAGACDSESTPGAPTVGAGAGATTSSGAGGNGTGGNATTTTASTGGGGGVSTLACTEQWETGFETGFPGEWLNYDAGAWSPGGTMPQGRVSAWTIVDSGRGEPVLSGDSSYKGWIEAAANESHRAYPVLHTDLQTPLVNTFRVYLDADYNQMGTSEWIHFGTWGNDDGNGNGKWALHTMSVRDRKLEFAHTTPFAGEYIGPMPQADFPTGQWVRFTAYLHYEGNTGFVQIWQDGVAMLRAEVSELGGFPGTKLTRAHWGMYASATTTQGVQYNDDIQLWTLASPLVDLDSEPDCYLGP